MGTPYRGTAPARGTTDLARMIDIDQAVTTYQPIATTKRSAWTFGGCDGSTNQAGFTSESQRTRFFPQQQPKRMRLHARNYAGSTDTAPTGTGPSIRSVFVGPQDTSSTANLWNTTSMDQVFSGTTTIQGLTEFVSGWYVPTYDMTKGPSIVSIGFTTPATTTVVPINNASHSIQTDDYTKAGALTTGALVGGPSSTGWYDFNYSLLEMWWEYEYADDAALVGMVIGHSLPDGVSYAGGSTPGWDGQMTGYPQQHGRKHKHSVIVNCYAGTTTASWASSSPKWNRFTDVALDYVIIAITENDLVAGTSAATIMTNLAGMIAKVMSIWTAAAIYIAVPVGLKPQDTNTTHEATRQTLIGNLNTLYADGRIEGLIDFERAAGTMGDLTTVDPRALDGAATSNKHFSPYGHARMADAVQVTGTRNTNLSPARGPLAFNPTISQYGFPQGVTATAATTYNALSALSLAPYIVGPGQMTVDAAAVNVTTAYSATATTLNVGIYTSGPDGMPVLVGGPIASASQSLNAAATGTKVLTFATPVVLQPGTYWIAAVLTGTAATAGALTTISATSYALPMSTFNTAMGKFLGASNAGLPTTAITVSGSTATTAPFVALRRSA